ncbi:MAG: hypothetical protein HY973_01015 [Candidatus Kerfeldbacteria bacterium]|nr:hypothetical protein [Candidatus Kerfeldbacteria bacterium]
MYLETSKDILNLALALAVIGLSFLIGWILVYWLLILRRVVQVLHGLEEGVRKFSELVTFIREKLESSASYLSVLAVGAKELAGYIMKLRTDKKGKKKV